MTDASFLPSVAAALEHRARQTPERTAYVFLAEGDEEQERLTYAALDAQARAIAAALRQSCAPGERALLLYPPGVDFLAAFFGCLYAGVIAVPAYPPRSPRSLPRLQAILADARPAVVLASAASRQRSLNWLSRLPEAAALPWITSDEIGPAPAGWEPAPPDGDAVAFLQYTSGSTSTPKGVMVTQANLAHNQRVIQEACGHSEDSVFVSWLPPYHDLGLIGNLLQATWVGAPCVLMAPVAFLQSPSRWLRAISHYRGTTSGGPNFAYDLCVRRVPPAEIEKLDLSSWRIAFNGAEPVREETLARFAETFAPAGFQPGAMYPCYGLAEATLMVSGGRPGEATVVREIDGRRLVGCGRVLSDLEVAIVEPGSGIACPPGAVGEIWVAGDSVAKGYWNRPEETAESFGATLPGGTRQWLRTGDLGVLDEGELFIAGRLKDLIILRGRNHYPQDLEMTAGRAHPALGEGTGAAFALDADGEERLVIVHEVARHAAGPDEIAAAVRQAIAEEHEALAWEVVLVPTGGVPRTTSGKVQRRACRDLYLRGELRVLGASRLSPAAAEDDPAAQAPPGSLDWLLRAFAAAARVDPTQVDPDRPLSASGLDSLAAVELKHSVEETTGVPLDLADLLEGMTLREVERQVAGGAASADARLAEVEDTATGGEAGEHPLSWNQQSLWFLHRLAPESPAYNIAGAARLHSSDATLLGRALQSLVDRHPMLRTTFAATPGGPVQRVAERAEADFTVLDATGWSDEDLRRRMHEEAFRPFDLSAGPLLRTVLLRRDGEDFLVLSLHHIVADFWSMTVLARELGALAADAVLASPRALYTDFARRQGRMLEGPAGERLWEHWRERLAGTPQLDLPTDRPRQPVQTLRGAARTLTASPERAEAVHRLAAAYGCTPFVALLAAWQTVLSRWSGQEEFLTGAPMAGRSGREWADVVGYFVNLVPLRAGLAGAPTVGELMARTRGTVLDALAHQDLPFALLTERLQPERDPSRPPLVAALLTFEKAPDPELAALAAFPVGIPDIRLALGGLVLDSLPLEPPAAQLDLSLIAAELPGGLAVSLQWDADLFDEATIERMLGHLDRLLDGMAGADRGVAERPLSELTGLSSEEVHQLVQVWGAERGIAEGEPSLLERIEALALAAPDHLAVAAADARLTYGELNARADRLARRLVRLGAGPEVRVAVCLERSPDLVATLLAVLKSGAAYVPLDPGYPVERLALLLEDSQALVLATRERYLDRFPAARKNRLLLLDEAAEAAAREEGEPALPKTGDSRSDPGHLAYVVYTSGSTGRPKGVCVERASLSGLTVWHRETYDVGPADRATLIASPAFDASTWELWSCLASGASLHIPPEELVASPPDLLAWLRGEGITLCFLPTPLAEAVLAEELPDGLALRALLTGGDRLRHAPERSLPFALVNHYGPTESTVVATCGAVEAGQRGPVPIGRPISGVALYLLDPSGHLVPIGAPGEICLGGRALARGYLGAAGQTAEKFVPSPWSTEPGARLYRTGDLARYRPDGALEFLGRIDLQAKIRGFRIEIGEIEAALSALPGVREAVVVVREDRPGNRSGDRRLVAYVTGDAAADALRSSLQERLPAYMVPAVFVTLAALPLTPNGKVDRKALPAPEWKQGEESFLAPRTPVEEVLAGLWAEVLGLERVGLHDSFFELGGHSLLATRVVARLRDAFGVELPLRALFERPTVAELAVRIEEARRGGADRALPPLVPVPRDLPLPLSFAQERLWFLDRLAPGQAVYNIPMALRLRGPVSVASLAASLTAVAARHEALRTTFTESAGGPVQTISPEPRFPLAVVDLTALPPAARQAEALRLAGDEARRPFDLAAGPLCRATLVRLEQENEEEHLFLISVHHIVFDGWSTGILLRELGLLFTGETLPPLPVQYADFAVWQRAALEGAAFAAQLDAWRERLAGAPPALDLPVDRRRPAGQTFRGGAEPVTLPAELVRALRSVARHQGATLFMTVLAGWAALLHRSSGVPEVILGAPVANRRQPELGGLIGLFVNTLPLRIDLGGDPSLAELLDQVRATTLDAYENQDVPFERLVEAVETGRDLSRSPLFQVMLALQDDPPGSLRLPGVTAEEVPLHNGTSKMELVLLLTGSEGALAGSLEFNSDLFDRATARRLADQLVRLLAGAAAAPRLPIGDIPLLAAAEERQILREWRGSAPPYPREAPVHELVAAQAAQAGDRIAVETAEARLTYAELESRANQLARHLHRLGVAPDNLVALALPRSPEMVTGLLGILKAGGAYLPLDPSWPLERLTTLTEEARPRALVTLEPLLDRLPGGIPVVCLDRDREALARERRQAPVSGITGVTADHLAYVLFTSGSTGKPKGVAVPHRAVTRLVRGGGFARLDAGETFLQLAPLSFDASTLEIWGALCNGGRLVLAPPEPPSLSELGQLLTRHRVTTLWLTAGLFHQMVGEEIDSLRGLSQLLAGGDVLSPLHVERALAELPGCALINGYGPTENTTFTCCHRFEEPPAEARVPIGRPIGNTTVVLLDRAGRPVPVGVPGELHAGGDGLARGYLGRPDLTAERFVPSPLAGTDDAAGARLYRTGDLARWRPDGTLDFLGRIDQQVKIRGFRIEPGEIEAALEAHPGVAACAVVVRPLGGTAGETKALVAYVVREETSLTTAELREHLRRRLPEFMVPAFFVTLPELPLTPNGKVDRRALPDPEREPAADLSAPHTPLEELLAGIWAEVLGQERVGIHDSFFDLGGHSLLATRVISRLRGLLGVELPVRVLFEQPTVAALAAAVEAASRTPAPPLVPHGHGTDIPLSPAQERLWFLDRLEPGNPAYNVPLALRLRGSLSAPALAAALAAVARRHEVLRTRFVESAGRPVQEIASENGLALMVVDLTGLPAAERPVEAGIQIGLETRRPFDLATGPVGRAILLRLEDEEHLLVIDVHHIAFDGWSSDVLLRELGHLYAGEPLSPLPVQYADFALWQRAWIESGALSGQLERWRERLAGAPGALDLPVDRPRPPVQTFRGGAEPVTLPAELVHGLRAAGRRSGATLFMTVLAGWSALLHRMSGAPEVIVGSPVANRRQPELEGLIGLFVNTLPLRVDLGDDPPFGALLDRVRTTSLNAYENQDVPFERLVDTLEAGRDLSRSPLFQVMLALRDGAAPALRLPGVTSDEVPLHNGTAKFELLLALNSTDSGLGGGLEFNADLFDRTTARRLTDQLARLLAGVTNNPDVPVGDLPLLGEAEERQILVDWNATEAPFPGDLGLHELFEAQAARTPEAAALMHGTRRVTYGELDAWADRLAWRLRALGVGPEMLVGVFCGRTPGMVAAALAVLKAGGAYLPLDPAYPADRLSFLLADSGAFVVLAEESVAAALPAFAGSVELVDQETSKDEDEARKTPRGFVHPGQAAYAIYTSGSTGVPKGVLIRHGSAVARITWALSAYPPDVLAGVLAATSLCFDLSVFEIFAPLAAGGAIILADDALALPRLPAAAAVTLVNTVPSAMAELVRAGALPRSVRVVNLAGEPLRRDLAERIYAQGVEEVHNLYGPSEDTTYSTGAKVARTTEPGGEREPAIGRPLPNTRTYLLDPARRPVPVGAAGELWLGGEGLARGYLGRPDLTAERFRPDPFGPSSGGRLYRTGDLVRRRSDGTLDYLGRLDHQVKIRGFRIELGEIEAALLAHPQVRQVVVVAREIMAREIAETRSLVAYVACGEARPATAELREHLRQRLPGHMVPGFFVTLSELPLTPNGKVDRRALPDPEREPAVADLSAPGTPVEELVAGIWAEVLGLERVGLHDSFFDLGGHSLLATRVIARLQSVLGIELPVRTLFERPTVAELAVAVEGASRVPAPPLVPRQPGVVSQLSPAQERLWFLDRLAPGQAVYNLPMILRLRGPVSAPGLAAALTAVASRHEALRTTFNESAGRPEATISTEPRLPLGLVDLTGLPPRMRQAEAIRQAIAETRRPFDLAAGPLYRAVLLRVDEEDSLFVINVHHIVFDGWSTGVLLRELGLLSRGETLPPLPVQYADFAAWQRAWLQSEALTAQLDAWRERLAGTPASLDLPTDRPRPPVQTFGGGAVPVALPAELVRDLRALGRRGGATLFMTVLAGWAVLLHRMSGAPEVIVGSPVANRRQPELEGLIGLFVNTLPLRVDLGGDLGGDLPFAELLGRVRATALAAYENQDVPFERLVDAVETGRDLSRSPLFQVMLALQDGAPATLRLPGVTAEEVPFHNGTAKFELLLSLQGEDDGLSGGLEFNTGLFDEATARRLAKRLAHLLAEAAAGPELRIGDLSLLDAAEERQILVEWNATGAPFPHDLGLHELFEAQAARTPEATALMHGTRRVSYRELDAWAGRLARRLRELGVGPEMLVGVFCGRTPGMVAAVLAVLKAGGAYLPLDPAYPADRLSFLLADSGASIVLTERSVAPALPPFAGTQVLVDGDSEGAEDGDRPRGFLHPDQMAYAIYTSGSTGTPKGVLVRHTSAVARITWALSAYPREVLAGVLAATSLCFDLSVFELFAPLAAGGAVILADNALALPSLPGASAVTLVNTVPSVMAELLGHGALPPSVRVVNLAGEPLRRDLAARIYAQDGVEEVHNLYGPSEDTTYSTGAKVKRTTERGDEREPAIGRPLPNTRAYLLDAGLRPVPVGLPGELWLGGAGVARGYLRRPDLTADRFRPDPLGPSSGGRLYRTGDLARQREDGTLDYLGRIDRQVKIRGFRIEPGEIETALLAHPGVRQAAVEVREIAGGEALVAYVAGAGDRVDPPLPAAAELRQLLRRHLPEHMIPAFFVPLAALPLTPNGKLDRKALPAPEQRPAEETPPAPRTPTEELLAGIWAEVLGLERVGIHDSFFEIGGHSLLATRVAARLHGVFGVELPLRTLFERPTVAELSLAIEEARRGGAERAAPPLVPVPREGPLPLSFAQERLWFIDQLAPGSALYNIPVALRLAGRLDARVLALTLGTIVGRHEALRTVFARQEDAPVQIIQPAAPVDLPLVDLSGLPADLKARLVRALAREEAGRPFDLRTGPLLRTSLLRLAAEEHVLLITMHHIASDGWSMGLLVHEVTALYAAFATFAEDDRPSPLPELPVQYADFAAWQRSWLRGEVLKKEIAFWRRQLAGLPPLLELPTDRPRAAVQGFRGASRPVRLPAALTRQVETLGRREGATLFMVLLAGFQALLARSSGQQDLAVGSPVAGRNRVETEGLIGFFVNTLVLRGDLSGDATFRELLRRVRETALAAYRHQDVPFEKLVQELAPQRNLTHAPLFQVMLALQNTPSRPLELPGLAVSFLPLETESSKFDLTLALHESEGTLAGSLEYDSGLFDAATMERLLDHLLRLTEAAAADPDLRLSALPLLSTGELRQLLIDSRGRGGSREEPGLPIHPQRGLHHLFEEQVERRPDATALVDQGRSMTYRELDRDADRLAHLLIARGVGPEVRVGLCLERSLEMVVGLLAVLKAGGAYVPLDPALPGERLLFQLQDAGVAVLVTQAASRVKVAGWEGPQLCLGGLDESSGTIDGWPEARPVAEIGGNHLAYVLYTSGSTGRPKGVAVTHANVIRLLETSREPFGFGPQDTWTLFHSYAFDFSVWELWGALALGGKVVVVPQDVARSPEDFFRLLRTERVTVLNQTPSAFRQLAPVWNALSEIGGEPPVRWIIFGGEALELPSLAPWLARRGPLPRLVNMYGITETTVHVTLRPVGLEDTAGAARSLIGGPLADLELYVADRALGLQPLGIPGELCVGGEGLARGYWQRPELTAERFVPDPWSGRPGARLYRSGDLGRRLPDGDVEYLGRIDHQVKVRGLRIELREIEATLGRHPAVRASVVQVVDRPGPPGMPGDRRLAAWVAVNTGVQITAAELRTFLGEWLADYMIPSTFVLMDALPLTANGKVDRAALPPLEGVRPELEVSFVAPRTREERAVAAAWQEVLGVEKVGVYDNFFDLGGHSLLMVQVQGRLREAFAREVPVLDLFQHPTVGALAQHLSVGQQETAEPVSFVASESRGESRRARAAEQQLQRRRRRTGRTGDFEA